MTKMWIRCASWGISSFHNSFDIDTALQKFWELEEVPNQLELNQEENEAEIIFQNTVGRANDGRYVVDLPFKRPPVPLGSSYHAALKRLHCMEQRFARNEELRTSYCNFMREYLNLGHMKKVHPHEIRVANSYYLPHHAVFKLDSSTTKLRVVFDGSSKSSTGNSLNDALIVGPTIQKDLFSVCLRFRLHRYVFTADLEKMYRQIWISEKHQDFQRILWRESPELPVEIYKLCTVTYGTSSAPFLAVRVLQQLASDYASTNSKASKILMENCYVDDILAGCSTPDELILLKSELVEVLSSAGFNLRKWSSNCWSFLATIDDKLCEFAARDFTETSKAIKTLGLQWFPPNDTFSFTISVSQHNATTKRNLLSDASRIFDPLGFLTPVTVLIKILFQSLWMEKLDWDDPVPESIRRQWLNIRNELSQLSNLHIPRWLGIHHDNFELHGFSDASEKAFAAVIYCRTSMSEHFFQCRLLVAKSRVAPLKQISIARLELCGALLLSKLFENVQKILHNTTYKLFAWTDSEIVLHWLSSQPRCWSTFVGNRTSEILSRVPRKHWRYIPSNENPADVASRGVTPNQMLKTELWWHGPQWLYSSEWPNWQPKQFSFNELNCEKRKKVIQVCTTTVVNSFLDNLCHRYSRWLKLIRIIAYCNRFINNKVKGQNQTGPLDVSEIETSKFIIFRYVQSVSFTNELKLIKSNEPLKPRSQLMKLTPFVDNNGLLRVCGRLKNSELSYDLKHPIILPKNHFITELIVRHFHFKFCHAGVSELFSLLRQEFWILGCRTVVRKVVHSCISCFRHRREVATQLMGQLPASRVTPCKPFSRVGCDYAGPITLRLFRGRNPKFSKGYICLFVCMTTKAVHVELVSDMTTNAFLAALRRLIARRGKCSHIYSDNGTNFKGAQRMLSEMHELLQSDTHNAIIQDALSQDGIQWSFNPPNAPHFGGLWESNIKSIKTHLKIVIGEHILTYEELYTVLTQIEALLNSRPLYSISDDELDALTPFHLLTGHSYTAVPEPNHLSDPKQVLSNWNLLQNMLQGFWKRWHQEYLTSLQQRPKWCVIQPNISKGDIVLLREANLPPAKWILAKVTEIHPDRNGVTRVVTVRTKSGELVRPITKLAKLPGQPISQHQAEAQDVTK